jgi:hypothetical protein
MQGLIWRDQTPRNRRAFKHSNRLTEGRWPTVWPCTGSTKMILENIKQALNNSSMNSQSTKKMKFDFTYFFIFNGLQPSKIAVHSCTVDTLNTPDYP